MNLMQLGFAGHNCHIFKSREIFKIQVSLNVDDCVLVYNKDRSVGQEFRGENAQTIVNHYGLHKFGKRKTYVFGRYLSDTHAINLEGDGEVPSFEEPDW